MRVIKNNNPKARPLWPKVVFCRLCNSELEVVKEDLHKGTVVYSQREIDHGVMGFTCPCCNEFQELKVES